MGNVAAAGQPTARFVREFKPVRVGNVRAFDARFGWGFGGIETKGLRCVNGKIGVN
jgi:hypothetical protein